MKDKEYYISPRIIVTEGIISGEEYDLELGDEYSMHDKINYDIDFACRVAAVDIKESLNEVNEESGDYGDLRHVTITAKYKTQTSGRTWYNTLFKTEYRLSGRNGWKFEANLNDLKKVPNEFNKLCHKVTIDEITDIKQLCDIANLMLLNGNTDYVLSFIEDVINNKKWHKLPSDRQIRHFMLRNYGIQHEYSEIAGNGTQCLICNEVDGSYIWMPCTCKK